ncbi:hypothetical protein [Ferrovum myxofaciens]
MYYAFGILIIVDAIQQERINDGPSMTWVFWPNVTAHSGIVTGHSDLS